jgi:branched-chain amino acid transport system ATP-binding protein
MFDHQEITSLNPAVVACMGLRHVPEGRELFPLLTVEENLKVGAGWRASAKDISENTEVVLDYFPRLKDRLRHLAGYLSGGEQQMVAIGRALMSRPKLLMLDEPSLGLSPLVREEVFRIVQRISRERQLPMLLVEQNARQALQIADFAYVLELGRIVMADTAERIVGRDEIQQFYLGKKQATIRGQQRWKRKKVWR